LSTKLKYPYNWGRSVVQAFVEKYARGTYIFARLVNLSPGEVRHYLILILCSGNNLKWESLKREIMMCCNYESGDIGHLGVSGRKALHKCLYDSAVNNQLDLVNPLEAIDSTRTHELH
jgi:hypothetical protein